jgi:hypothetical protein
VDPQFEVREKSRSRKKQKKTRERERKTAKKYPSSNFSSLSPSVMWNITHGR